MDPINYSGLIANPLTAFNQGLQAISNVDQYAIQRQAQQAQLQQLQLAQQKKAQAGQLFNQLISNPNASAKDFLQLEVLDPTLTAPLKQYYERQSEAGQQQAVGALARVGGALSSGRPDIAQNFITDRITAANNAGDTKAAGDFKVLADIVNTDPTRALGMVRYLALGTKDPEKLINSFGKVVDTELTQAKTPLEVQKLAGDAATAQAKGVRAGEIVAADLDETIAKTEAARADVKIKALTADLAKETNELKREELRMKIQEAMDKRDTTGRERQAAADTGRTNVDNALSTIDRVLKNPELNAVVGSLEGKEYYPNTILGTFRPGADGDARADAIQLIETIKSQAFLSQVGALKGMGALSNTEGEKLQSALQNLSRVQSETQFRVNLKEAQRLLLKARDSIEKVNNVSPTIPDRPGTTTNQTQLENTPVKTRSYMEFGRR